MEHSLTTTALVKKYGKFRALKGLDLAVRTGEIYGLLGPNGAGKTTTIRICCGLTRPSGGTVVMLGRKVPDRRVKNAVGYMPQETALYMGLTVTQNMRFFGRIHGLSKKEIAAREEELLEFVDLKGWRKAMVRTLSGGMKHRLSLACTLMHRPSVLFLDEPTVGVDPALRVSFWDHFQALKKEGVTILITTHYMDEARRCDRVGFMREGALMTEGGPEELLRDTGTGSLEDAYLVYAEKGREQ